MCIICQIVNQEIKSFIVYEDQDFIAFLDHHPLFLGHTLLSPKQHYVTVYDLPSHLIIGYFQLLQKLGKAVENAMVATGSFIGINNVVSQSIAHLHTHIVPRKLQDGLKGFFWPRTRYASDDEFINTRDKIIQSLRNTTKA